MIQRKQSVFLLLAAIATLICLMLPVGAYHPDKLGVDVVMYNLWIIDGNGAANFCVAPLFGILFIETLISLATIFLYKNRKLQIKLCSWNILLVVLWYIVYVTFAYTDIAVADSDFGLKFAAVLPLVALILVVMARNGVKSDEALIRAADRIR